LPGNPRATPMPSPRSVSPGSPGTMSPRPQTLPTGLWIDTEWNQLIRRRYVDAGGTFNIEDFG